MSYFTYSIPFRVLPSRLSQLTRDDNANFNSASNINWNSQLGRRCQSIASGWCHIKRDVHPNQSVGSRQAWSNTHKLAWKPIQYFSYWWLITAKKSRPQWGSLTPLKTWLANAIMIQFQQFRWNLDWPLSKAGLCDWPKHQNVDWPRNT